MNLGLQFFFAQKPLKQMHRAEILTTFSILKVKVKV